MRPRNRTLLVLFAVLFLATLSQPAAAAYLYDWDTGPSQIVNSLIENPPALTLKPGQDITHAYYAADPSYRYFRMDLKGIPDTGSNGYAPLYSIQTSVGGTINTFAFPFPPPSLMFASGTTGLGPVFGQQIEQPGDTFTLEWRIARDKLPDTFAWYGLTGTHNNGALSGIFDITAPAVVTPIPSAALLLGTGIVGLIGLRRRSFRKA
jgi:hypothetical protein